MYKEIINKKLNELKVNRSNYKDVSVNRSSSLRTDKDKDKDSSLSLSYTKKDRFFNEKSTLKNNLNKDTSHDLSYRNDMSSLSKTKDLSGYYVKLNNLIFLLEHEEQN